MSMETELAHVLAFYPAAARPRSAVRPLGNAGGLSGARLWWFDAAPGPMAVRLWPRDGPNSAQLGQIHRWLAPAGPLGFVPLPLATADGRTFVARGDRLWQVEPWMPGAADDARPPSTARLRSAFAALGALHRALGRLGSGPSPGLARRLAEMEALRSGELADFDRALVGAPADERRELARRWLGLAGPMLGRLIGPTRADAARAATLQPCLRDARAEHFLFVGDRVGGLVDFGAMGVEVVAADLARVLADWVGDDRAARAEALAAYEAVRPLDPTEMALIASFERTAALLGGARWLRWHFVEGRAFEDSEAVTRGLRRGNERLAALAGGHL